MTSLVLATSTVEAVSKDGGKRVKSVRGKEERNTQLRGSMSTDQFKSNVQYSLCTFEVELVSLVAATKRKTAILGRQQTQDTISAAVAVSLLNGSINEHDGSNGDGGGDGAGTGEGGEGGEGKGGGAATVVAPPPPRPTRLITAMGLARLKGRARDIRAFRRLSKPVSQRGRIAATKLPLDSRSCLCVSFAQNGAFIIGGFDDKSV
jgi:hypothetical protein